MGRPALDFLSMYELDALGCWRFTGKLTSKGYGQAGSHGQAHRYFYEQHVGPIPDGLTVDHLCRFHSCVNPAHMEPVTFAENTRRERAQRAAVMHCKHGHPFDDQNTYVYPNGERGCRLCRKRAKAEYRERGGVH